jgi:imidazolonepropionase-like amidohydrolase
MKILFVLTAALFLGYKNDNIDLVISNPKIINTEDGSLTLNHDILIKGNVIVNIAPHRNNYDRSVKIIDAHNMYAIPGLWDMHVHALWSGWFEICNPLMVAYGVTGFRDMWGELKFADTVRKKMVNDKIPFQRFILAGGLVDGARPIWPGSQVADNPERGVELVDSLYRAGADFIKVYSRLTPETFYAIAKRCRELNIKFLGHVPQKVKLIDASNAGMYSMEHLLGITEAFSDIEDSIFAIVNKVDFATASPTAMAALLAERQTLLAKRKIVPEKVEKTSAVLRSNHTWIVPTLAVQKGFAYMDVLDTVKDERFDYLPHEITDSWKIKNDFRVKNRTAQQWKDAKTIYKNNVEQLRLINKNRVAILAGTDLGNPYCFPGSSLHDELELMTEAGLTSLQALQTATFNAAKYLDKTDSLGTIAPNKYADILLLSENPLDNISNTKKIEGVCVNGKFYNKKDLESLKQQAKSISVKMNGKNK